MSEPDRSAMWSDPTADTLQGVPIRSFPIERNVVYLTQHMLHHGLGLPLRAYLDLILICRSRTLNSEQLRKEAGLLSIPFGALFVLRVARDLFGETAAEECPDLLNPHKYKKERESALRSTLLLSPAGTRIKPGMEEFINLPLHKRLRSGLRLIFTTADHVRSRYPEAVRRFGLPGGYIARINFLRRYSRPVRKNHQSQPARADFDFSVFNARESLCEWIHELDRCADPSGKPPRRT